MSGFIDSLVCVILLLSYTGQSAGAILTSFPTDTEAVVGQTVILKCSTSVKDYVLWEYTPVGTSTYEYVFLSGRIIKPYNERCTVEGDFSAGEYNLVIDNVQLSDAGLYGCVDQAGQGERREAQLIVLVSQPTCNSSDEVAGENPCDVPEEKVKIQCEIEYSGNRPPMMECGAKDNFIDTASVANTTKTSQTKATYDLTSNMDPMTMKDSTLNCRTSQSKIASNDFHTKVLYMEKEPSIHISIRPEHLICVFESSLPCRYRWLYALSNMGIFIEDNVMLGHEPGLYRCEAECSLRDKQCVVLSPIIEIPGDEYTLVRSGTKTRVVILATVCVVVTVIIISLICLLIYRRKKGEKARGGPKHDKLRGHRTMSHSVSLNEKQKTASEMSLIESDLENA